MSIEKIIVLEDDAIVRNNLENFLRRQRFDVAAAPTLAAAREYLNKDSFDLIFMDMRLPDGEGIDLLKQLHSRPQKPLAVVMTGFGSVESAVECMKNGAFDYIIKPFSTDQIEFTLRKAQDFNQLLKVNTLLSQESDDGEQDLLGRSLAMENLRSLIRKVARTQATVLIQGESGTGKELVARALYRESPRANAPFIKVNCAAVPENLIESEFFGHEKGAFTGALAKREGRFELAHGGTILLDEISEISPALQAKLLRVLQEREFERVGGNRTIKVDVRVIATTNRNLDRQRGEERISAGLVFPAECRARLRGAAARTARGYSLARHGIHAPVEPQTRRSYQRLHRRGAARAQRTFLAGKRPRIAECRRARRDFVRRKRDAGTGTFGHVHLHRRRHGVRGPGASDRRCGCQRRRQRISHPR